MFPVEGSGQGNPAPVQPALHGPDGGAERLRDGFVGLAVNVVQDQDASKLRGHPEEGSLDVHGFDGGVGWIAHGDLGQLVACWLFGTATAEGVEADVHRHAVQPRGKGRLPSEAAELAEAGEEDILGRVERVFPPPQHPVGDGVDASVVPLDQPRERVPVAFDEPADQLLVGAPIRQRSEPPRSWPGNRPQSRPVP